MSITQEVESWLASPELGGVFPTSEKRPLRMPTLHLPEVLLYPTRIAGLDPFKWQHPKRPTKDIDEIIKFVSSAGVPKLGNEMEAWMFGNGTASLEAKRFRYFLWLVIDTLGPYDLRHYSLAISRKDLLVQLHGDDKCWGWFRDHWGMFPKSVWNRRTIAGIGPKPLDLLLSFRKQAVEDIEGKALEVWRKASQKLPAFSNDYDIGRLLAGVEMYSSCLNYGDKS